MRHRLKAAFLFTLDRVIPTVFVFFLCIALVACSFASFASAAESDIPVVIQMISNITNIVAPGVSAILATAGATAVATLVVLCGSPAPGATQCDPTSMVGQYQAATGAAKTTLLQKIQAALTAANNSITAMLNIAKGLPTSVAAAIVTAIGVALQTVTLLISLVPVAVSTSLGAMSSVQRNALKAIPHPKVLKAQFNAAIGSQYPAAVLQ